jgi:hypothetical protein
LEKQRSTTRFFSQEEFDRLKELSNKMFDNAGSPYGANHVPELPIESFDADEWLGEKYGIWGHPFIGEQQVSSLMAEFAN